MRILALETDVEELKRKFLVEGEKAALVTHRHFLVFIVRMFWPVLISLIVIPSLLFGVTDGLYSPDIATVVFLLWLVIFLYLLSSARIAWKYNFLIVTTQKIVIVEQKSVFYQQINPLHFDNIANTRTETQFGGIFRCGIVYVNVKIAERLGTQQELANPYIPEPDNVAAVIENGVTLHQKEIRASEEAAKQRKMQEPSVDGSDMHPETLEEDRRRKRAEGIGIGEAIEHEESPPDKQ